MTSSPADPSSQRTARSQSTARSQETERWSPRLRRLRRIVGREGSFTRVGVRPGSAEHLELAWVRTPLSSSDGVTFVVIPGGPGLSSIGPYVSFRRLAARRGLDVLMVEHRGLALSSRLSSGATIAPEDVRIEHAADDLAAALDAAGVDRAVIVGSSYGTYLAQAFAVAHPERVAALVLDSTMLSVVDDLAMTRAHRRRLLWDGDIRPGEDPLLREAAELVRAQAGRGEPAGDLAHVVQVVYEFAGAAPLRQLLRARAEGRGDWLWSRLVGLGSTEIAGAGVPGIMEPAPVAGIAYGQLGYGLPPDGGPLDPQLLFSQVADEMPEFTGEPMDLPGALADYSWPTLVLSGARDLRTPRPVAERLVAGVPHGMLVDVHDVGHSLLDVHTEALLTVLSTLRSALETAPATAADTADQVIDTVRRDLPGPEALAALPRRGASALVSPALRAAITACARPRRRGPSGRP